MTARASVTAIVLAGGRSTRFGSTKLDAELDGRPLLDHVLHAVGLVADEVVLAGGSGAGAAHETGGRPIRTIDDDEPFAGPLAALAGALRDTTTELAIVVGGDMPALVPAVLEAMLGRLGDAEERDAVLLASPVPGSHRRQVLPLALRAGNASSAAAQALAVGDRSLVRMLDRLRSIEIPASEWLALDPAGRTLLDVDRPADLERIRGELR